MDEPVLVTRPEPGITVVTLNRPERLNALTNEMLELLLGILGEIERDPQCRAVILTGAGRGFCGGLDLQANAQAISQVGDRVEDSVAWAERFGALAPALRNLRQPVVAAVNGPAAGGGLVLALAADIRVASSDALFLNGFINTGASGCELGLSYLLPRQIGMARAMELALTGRPIDAGEAERIGLVASVTASDGRRPTDPRSDSLRGRTHQEPDVGRHGQRQLGGHGGPRGPVAGAGPHDPRGRRKAGRLHRAVGRPTAGCGWVGRWATRDLRDQWREPKP